jgi:hypothetical protein
MIWPEVASRALQPFTFLKHRLRLIFQRPRNREHQIASSMHLVFPQKGSIDARLEKHKRFYGL